jgi:hypothetical protein
MKNGWGEKRKEHLIPVFSLFLVSLFYFLFSIYFLSAFIRSFPSSSLLYLKLRRVIRRSSIVLLSALLLACSPAGEPAYLFAANFYGSPVSLRVGEEPGPVFAVDGLPPNEVSGLSAVRRGGEFAVLYRADGRDDWQRLPRALEAETCPLEAGTVTAVVVDRRGFIRAQKLGDDPRPGARLAFLNASNVRLASLVASAPGGEAFPAFWVKDLKPNAATRFRSVVPGEYRLSAVPAEAGAGFGSAPGPGSVSCRDSSYWLLYCCPSGNEVVLRARLLAVRENGRLVPP